MHNIGDLLAPQIPRLRRYARSLTKDWSRAEDLLQGCLVRALEKEHLWEPGSNLRAWLFTIMHNQYVNEIRRLVREASLVPIQELNVNLRAGQTVDAVLELSDAEQAIADLPRDQRDVIILASKGQHYEEMARDLGVPIGTVRSRLSRGRTRMRELMGMSDAKTNPRRRWAHTPLRRAA
jgi:RNA polymerase sigma-70 factor (ECF subfamily)